MSTEALSRQQEEFNRAAEEFNRVTEEIIEYTRAQEATGVTIQKILEILSSVSPDGLAEFRRNLKLFGDCWEALKGPQRRYDSDKWAGYR